MSVVHDSLAGFLFFFLPMEAFQALIQLVSSCMFLVRCFIKLLSLSCGYPMVNPPWMV